MTTLKQKIEAEVHKIIDDLKTDLHNVFIGNGKTKEEAFDAAKAKVSAAAKQVADEHASAALTTPVEPTPPADPQA